MSRIVSAAGALVNTIKINVVSREERDGRFFWVKRRRRVAGPIMSCANYFFDLAGNSIRTLTDAATWQRWEVECFLRLHGDAFNAFALDLHSVAAQEVPGQSLSRHLEAGTLEPMMLAAAANELRRAHEMDCPTYGAPWSHGDAHTGNFVYESDTRRARLIDFEVMHHPHVSAEKRHAEDLLALLQDLAGRISADRWMPAAQAFLAGYGRPEIVARVRERLVVPDGFARIWWAVRTTYLAPAELRRRIAELRASL